MKTYTREEVLDVIKRLHKKTQKQIAEAFMCAGAGHPVSDVLTSPAAQRFWKKYIEIHCD
jgi:hypothetical protein